MISEREVLTFWGQLCFRNESIPFEIDEFFRYRLPKTRQSETIWPIVYVAPGDHLFNRNTYSVFRLSKSQEQEIVGLLRLIDPDIEGFIRLFSFAKTLGALCPMRAVIPS